MIQDPNLIPLAQVMNLTGLGRARIYKLIGIGSFPKAIRLNYKTARWEVDRVSAWIASRLVARAGSYRNLITPERKKRPPVLTRSSTIKGNRHEFDKRKKAPG